MARIGFKPVVIPAGVTVDVQESAIVVKGPKGELNVHLPKEHVSVEVKGNELLVHANNMEEQDDLMNQGTVRANLANAMKGVSEGFKKELIIGGTGYRAAMRGTSVVLSLGYSHEVVIEPIAGSKITLTDELHVVVEGPDKQAVGQTAALIHDARRPWPYSPGNELKGVKYKNERLIHKVGKRATATAKK
jgi:large subunit ribosomal protein L6